MLFLLRTPSADSKHTGPAVREMQPRSTLPVRVMWGCCVVIGCWDYGIDCCTSGTLLVKWPERLLLQGEVPGTCRSSRSVWQRQGSDDTGKGGQWFMGFCATHEAAARAGGRERVLVVGDGGGGAGSGRRRGRDWSWERPAGRIPSIPFIAVSKVQEKNPFLTLKAYPENKRYACFLLQNNCFHPNANQPKVIWLVD